MILMVLLDLHLGNLTIIPLLPLLPLLLLPVPSHHLHLLMMTLTHHLLHFLLMVHLGAEGEVEIREEASEVEVEGVNLLEEH